MKPLTTHLKCMQLIKFHIMKYSVDEETSYVYGHMLARSKGKKNWNGAKELEERDRERESVIYSLMSSVEVSKEGMELVL